MQDFVDDIKPAVMACGLTFPKPEAIGLEVPASLELQRRRRQSEQGRGLLGVRGVNEKGRRGGAERELGEKRIQSNLLAFSSSRSSQSRRVPILAEACGASACKRNGERRIERATE